MPLGSTDVYDVLVALIANASGIISAALGWFIFKRIGTPSGTAIGKQVESAHHVALGNNYRLQRLTGELNVAVPTEAEMEEAKAQPPNG